MNIDTDLQFATCQELEIISTTCRIFKITNGNPDGKDFPIKNIMIPESG